MQVLYILDCRSFGIANHSISVQFAITIELPEFSGIPGKIILTRGVVSLTLNTSFKSLPGDRQSNASLHLMRKYRAYGKVMNQRESQKYTSNHYGWQHIKFGAKLVRLRTINAISFFLQHSTSSPQYLTWKLNHIFLDVRKATPIMK